MRRGRVDATEGWCAVPVSMTMMLMRDRLDVAAAACGRRSTLFGVVEQEVSASGINITLLFVLLRTS